jgi:predicted HicB family RNase H-like nuclease
MDREVYFVVDEQLSSLVVRIDKDLHKQLKTNCVLEGISIKDYISGLIQKDLEEKNKDGKQ